MYKEIYMERVGTPHSVSFTLKGQCNVIEFSYKKDRLVNYEVLFWK